MSDVSATAATQATKKPARQRKVKGPRPRHIPQRTCIACRSTGAKRGLIRLVRTVDGSVAVDPTGKQAGRGAYLCNRMSCWRAAVNERVLGRALRIEHLSEENRAALLRYADERVPEDESDEATENSTTTAK